LSSNLLKFYKIFSNTWDHLQQARDPKSDINQIKFSWTNQLFELLNLELQIKGQVLSSSSSMILVGNHISYLDILLLLRACPEACFLSKQEVKYWPIIGPGAVKAETLFVKRESKKSRQQVRQQIVEALQTSQKKLALFPSGTTTIGPSERWKKGVFEIAQEAKIPIQPFRVVYKPLRAAAYIDKDFFPTHVYGLLQQKKMQAFIEFGTPFNVSNLADDLLRTKAWCEENLQAF